MRCERVDLLHMSTFSLQLHRARFAKRFLCSSHSYPNLHGWLDSDFQVPFPPTDYTCSSRRRCIQDEEELRTARSAIQEHTGNLAFVARGLDEEYEERPEVWSVDGAFKWVCRHCVWSDHDGHRLGCDRTHLIERPSDKRKGQGAWGSWQDQRETEERDRPTLPTLNTDRSLTLFFHFLLLLL